MVLSIHVEQNLSVANFNIISHPIPYSIHVEQNSYAYQAVSLTYGSNKTPIT